MTNEPLSVEKFKAQIEELFGQPLTAQAAAAAEDFWANWYKFESLVAQRSLSVQVDALRLGQNFPEYKRYHIWKGAGTVAIAVGVVLLWFFWQAAIAIVAAGVAFHFWGGRVRFNDAKKFADELLTGAASTPADSGYARLVANYIAGIIQFGSPAGRAHWPQHPSNVLNGEQTFISM